MKIAPALCFAGVALLLAGCTGGMMAGSHSGGGAQSEENGSGPSSSGTGSYAPCTDAKRCCSGSNQLCTSFDPDSPGTCTCVGLWDCAANPTKCASHNPLTPAGGGQWTCRWSPQAYLCVGGDVASKPNGFGGWSCISSQGSWACKASTVPNPTNSAAGLGAWSCTVTESNQVSCERIETAPVETAPVETAPTGEPTDTGKGTDSGTAKESNCADGIDNDGDGLVDCKDTPDCAACPTACPPGEECCDGKDNDGDGRIDEGNVCGGLGETAPCPPGAYQSCDCYCGVHRKCRADGTWGPCVVDDQCEIARVTTQDQCGQGEICDFGECVPDSGGYDGGYGAGCVHHSDCPTGQICDMGACELDPYHPEQCPSY